MEFPAAVVWALAVCVDQEILMLEQDRSPDKERMIVSSKRNRLLVKQRLRENNLSMISDQDTALGYQLRRSVQLWLLPCLAGNSTIITETALSVAAIDVFTSSNIWELAVVASMPDLVRKVDPVTGLPHPLTWFDASEPLTGNIDQKISGEMIIMKCTSSIVGTCTTVARFNQTIVYFWQDTSQVVGTVVQFTARVVGLNYQGLTRLRQVKIF